MSSQEESITNEIIIGKVNELIRAYENGYYENARSAIMDGVKLGIEFCKQIDKQLFSKYLVDPEKDNLYQAKFIN